MGRRPNPIISKHFKRGNKIQDSSNRYEQSCKHCGENFPKGRTDALRKHIIKDCPGVSELERAEVAHDTNHAEEEDVSVLAALDQNFNSISNDERLKVLANTALDRREAFSGEDQPSPLKRLKTKDSVTHLHVAESFSLDNPPPHTESSSRTRGNRNSTRSRGRTQARNSPLNLGSGRVGEHTSTTASSTNAEVGAISAFSTRQPQLGEASYANGGNANTTNYPDGLNGNGQENIDPILQHHIPQPIIDSAFHNQTAQIDQPPWIAPEYYPNGEQYEDTPTQEEFINEMPEPAYDQTLYTHEYPTASGSSPTTKFSPETGDGKRSKSQRQRGKFDQKRKEEVRQMRSLGACVRCRVLKKPCTPGEPCQNCQNITDPRVWTFKCTRERIDTAFFHFKCNIYSILAYVKTISGLKETSPPGIEEKVIDVTQFLQSGKYISFKSRRGISPSYGIVAQEIPAPHYDADGIEVLMRSIESESLDPAITSEVSGAPNTIGTTIPLRGPGNIGSSTTAEATSNAGSDLESLSSEIKLLQHEAQDIPTKLMEYMRQIITDTIANDPNTLTRHILSEAQKHAADWVHDAQKHSVNVSEKALEVYATVRMLLSKDLSWHISERSTDAVPGSGAPILPGTRSYEIIVKQLQAAAEKNASLLVENLVASVDRMLLKSYSKQRFDLFIVGLIILDALEKATWEFCDWQRVYQADPRQWPLTDRVPTDFIDKRRSIAELLSNLLRVRDIPAATKVDNNGFLSTERPGDFQNFYKQVALPEQQVYDAFNMDPATAFQPDNPFCFHLSLSAWLLLPVERLPKFENRSKSKSP